MIKTKQTTTTTTRVEMKPGIPEITMMMVSLGCAKNLVDSENMCQLARNTGIRLVFDPREASVIVVNTCGFIESAKKEAIDKILEMAEYKRNLHPDKIEPDKDLVCDFLIVTGCLAQRYASEIRELIPEVDAVLGTASYGLLPETIFELYLTRNRNTDVEQMAVPIIHAEKAGSINHLLVNRTPTTSGFAYIKVAEGCSNCCTYCAIPGIRGAFQSRPLEDLVKEAEYLADHGIYEVLLIAQDTTRYGTDLYGYPALPELIHRISQIGQIRTIRILYCYVDGITEDLIREMKENPKVAKYIEMPIQHASDAVLKRMNRRDTKEKIRQTVETLRKEIPGIVIRTTVMTGFPGETEEEFQELNQFITKMKFDLLGCFVFSPEEGTPAYKMKPKIPKKVAKQRYNTIMQTQKKITLEKNRKIINKKMLITIESITEDGVFYLGRSDAQAPEIDPMILVAATNEPLENGRQYLVKIVEINEYELIGVTCK